MSSSYVPEAEAGDDALKEQLQRRMEETRESIAQTVTEIKDTMTEKYDEVKQTVADTFDWREQFRSHPAEWSLAALSLGLLVGYKVSDALRDSEVFDGLYKELGSVSERLAGAASELGEGLVARLADAEDYVVPAVAGAAVPLLAGKLKEYLGLDLSDVLSAFGGGKDGRASRKRKKKGATKKKGKKKKGKAARAEGS